MAKQSVTTRATSKAAASGREKKIKKVSEIKTPRGGKKRSTNKSSGRKNEEENELVSHSPKTRAAKVSGLNRVETPHAPMKAFMNKPPKIKANKIKTLDAQKKKFEENEGLDDEGKKMKKEKSSKHAATKKNK